MFYAHSAKGKPESQWQPLNEHLEGVSLLAWRFGSTFGTGNAARLAGLLHDLGKYTPAFQARLAGGEPVNHSTAGAVVVRELAADPRDRIMAELISRRGVDRNFAEPGFIFGVTRSPLSQGRGSKQPRAGELHGVASRPSRRAWIVFRRDEEAAG